MMDGDGLGDVVRSYFDAAAAGEVGRWCIRHVPDAGQLRLIGTQQHEVLVGEDALDYLTSGDGHVSDVRVDLRDLEVREHGPVGWVFTRPQMIRSGRAPLDLRWTAVFVREHDDWILKQIHVSRPVD